jgi:hypothetical protein
MATAARRKCQCRYSDLTSQFRSTPPREQPAGENSKPRDYPGSLPLEAALRYPPRNCRRILRQASERPDPGMTGTLGDGPAGRGRAGRARHGALARAPYGHESDRYRGSDWVTFTSRRDPDVRTARGAGRHRATLVPRFGRFERGNGSAHVLTFLGFPFSTCKCLCGEAWSSWARCSTIGNRKNETNHHSGGDYRIRSPQEG